MRKKMQFLREDIFIQKVLIGLVIISMIFPVFLVFTLPILGLWQLFSGCHLAFRLKDPNGKIYLLTAMIWLLIMGIPFMPGYDFTIIKSEYWFGLIYIIVPLIIAGGYLKYTIETLEVMEEYAICQF